MRYFVIDMNGGKHGPADLPTLAQWANEGRIIAGMTLEDELGGRHLAESLIPSLAAGQQTMSAPPGPGVGTVGPPPPGVGYTNPNLFSQTGGTSNQFGKTYGGPGYPGRKRGWFDNIDTPGGNAGCMALIFGLQCLACCSVVGSLAVFVLAIKLKSQGHPVGGFFVGMAGTFLVFSLAVAVFVGHRFGARALL